MSTKSRRDYLNDHTDAHRAIELAGTCIEILEGLNGATPAKCIKQLQHYQQQALRRADSAAEKLDAAYPG